MDPKNLEIDLSRFNRSDVVGARLIRRTPAGCALDLGDGSERAEYVNQDYIINKLGRLHRNIGLMYTYYPKDKQWPERISVACADMKISYQWDYPYDDYFPYGGGTGGSLDAEPFNQMRDIRRHGQDVTLTLTVDCSLNEEYLVQIARDLRTFGRMRIRINHECAGSWFTHNQRFSYQEIADFFVRFHNIIKCEAPNVDTVFCAGFIKDDGYVEWEKEFLEAYKTADVWSGDKYFSLHFGWPFDICEKGDYSYAADSVDNYVETARKTMERLYGITGRKVPFSASEFNSDGDVTGPVGQGKAIVRFAEYIAAEKPEWFNSMSMYQFRDRGRLGLELEDPNNSGEGIEQPLMDDYKKIMDMPYFQPGYESLGDIDYSECSEDSISDAIIDTNIAETSSEALEDISIDGSGVKEYMLRWGSAEDAEGLEFDIKMKDSPVFFELALPKEQNLIIEVNGRWFYKSPDVAVIDAMPAFFARDAKAVQAGDVIKVRIFAPPAAGENPDTGADDWDINYYTEVALPKFRIRYEACAEVK